MLYVFGLNDIVAILSDIDLISKSILLSVIAPLLATRGTESTPIRTGVLETRA